ncbi:hypothetical protein ACVWZR_007767 [Bradyrhizobium sp. i1.3.1]
MGKAGVTPRPCHGDAAQPDLGTGQGPVLCDLDKQGMDDGIKRA